MRIKDYLRLGWDQLRRRKVVTALCATGIAIGSSSIIVALSFGESVNYYAQKQMGYYMKTDEIMVRGAQTGSPGDPGGSREAAITDQMIQIIKSLPHVKAVAPNQELGYYEFTVDRTKTGHAQVFATDLSTLEDFGYQLQQASGLDMQDAAVVSFSATTDIFDERTARIRSLQQQQSRQNGTPPDEPVISYPLYQKRIALKMNGGPALLEFPVHVAGVMKKPEGMPDNMLRSQKQIFISTQMAKQIRSAARSTPSSMGSMGSGPSELKVKVDETAHVAQVEQWIKKLKLNTQTNLYQQSRMNQEFLLIRIIFGGVGLFVLFVASISIVVAMTMSTYQRRRQIGIMKVLGSNLKQIRNMFIVESSLLGLLGGLLGILLSYWVIWIINIFIIHFTHQGEGAEFFFIRFWILPVGLFFALLTGVLSGLYPAVKASRTDALTAIKRE